MAIRPTEKWLDSTEEPDARWNATDEALRQFERDLRGSGSPSDEEVLGLIQSVVEALNDVNGDYNAFDARDRVELCDFIDESLVEAGIDLDGLAERTGVARGALTDEWRDW